MTFSSFSTRCASLSDGHRSLLPPNTRTKESPVSDNVIIRQVFSELAELAGSVVVTDSIRLFN